MSDESTPKELLDPENLASLTQVSAATISMQLLKRGVRRNWIQTARPLLPDGPRVAGEAFTFRFIPLREDLGTLDHYKGPRSIRAAIETVPPGSIVVIDSHGEQGAATLGDILIARLKARGALAVVSDGPMRDLAEIKEVGLPVFCSGAAAPPSLAALLFAGWQEQIGCGGVAVVPGDVIVCDDDGCVVVPRALAADVARDAPEQERFERFAQMRVRAGATVVGLYPPSEETLAAYQRWVEAGEPEE